MPQNSGIIQVFILNKLLADLKDKDNPPYLCPISSCSFQTLEIQSWIRHYGVSHKKVQIYLLKENLPGSVKSVEDECGISKINDLGLESQKIKNEFIQEVQQLIYPSSHQQLSGENVMNLNEKFDFIHVENDEDLDFIDASLPWL